MSASATAAMVPRMVQLAQTDGDLEHGVRTSTWRYTVRGPNNTSSKHRFS